MDPHFCWFRHFLGRKIFHTKIFFRPKIFRTRNFFGSKSIIGIKISLKFFLYKTCISWAKILTEPKNFSDPHFFLTQNELQWKTISGGRKQSFWTWGFLNWQGQWSYFIWSLKLKTKSCIYFFSDIISMIIISESTWMFLVAFQDIHLN